MVAVLVEGAAQMAMAEGGTPNGKLEEPDHSSSNWYFSREEIEKRSPSRLDGIDLKKETYFRKSYCTFLQDLGMCLKVPQVTIATAIVFSHRFFLRQSHLKNDRHMIATICMFLAGKVEETPRTLRDVILMSYEIRNKKDPAAVARIKQKDIYEEQKELVLVGERLVLTSLGFDLNILHPYKPLVAAIKKLKVAQNALAQVAWNFVNDGLRTSLCLQFKPHHIAAGAIFLAAKFLKVKLPSDGEKVWWQEFEVTPRQLEEVSNQMLELYEQNKTHGPPNGSRSSDPGSSVLTVDRLKGQDAVPSANGHHWNHNSSNTTVADKMDKHAQTVKTDDTVTSIRRDEVSEVSVVHAPQSVYQKQENGHAETEYEPAHENGSISVPLVSVESTRAIKPPYNGQVKHLVKEEVKEQRTIIVDGQIKEELRESKFSSDVRVKSEPGTILRKARVKTEVEDRMSTIVDGAWTREVTEAKSSIEERDMEDVVDSKPGVELNMASVKVKVEIEDEEPKKGWSTTNFEDVDADRVKALAQKRRKSKGEGMDSKPAAVKVEVTDEEELLERELESGVEAAAEAERVKQEVRDLKFKPAQKVEHDRMLGKKEGIEEGEVGWKRRRINDEDDVNEKKRTKSSERGDRVDWGDGEADRSRAGGGPTDRTEDGELPSSSHGHDQQRSPRQLERRPVAFGSHDKNGSPSSKRHRDPHGRRDGHRDGRFAHGPRDRDHYPRDNYQHRTDGNRNFHHRKDREYVDRDHKKVRVHDLHGS